jgi:hypothetical protein
MVLLYLISVVILLMIFEDRQLRLVMMRFCAPLVHRQNTRFSMLQSLVWYFIRQESDEKFCSVIFSGSKHGKEVLGEEVEEVSLGLRV